MRVLWEITPRSIHVWGQYGAGRTYNFYSAHRVCVRTSRTDSAHEQSGTLLDRMVHERFCCNRDDSGARAES
jgi:hypothetical protein